MSVSKFDRPLLVSAPFTPRARVQLRALHSRMLHREQIVARRHPRSAIADDPIGWSVADRRAQLRAQRLGRSHQPRLVEIRLKEMISRAGNVSRHAIERFDFAAEALGRAR